MGVRPDARGGGAGNSQGSDISSAIYQLGNLFEPHCHHPKNKDTIIYPGKLLPCSHQVPAPAALYQVLGFADTYSWSPHHHPARQGLLLTLFYPGGNRSSERRCPRELTCDMSLGKDFNPAVWL